MRKLHFAVLAAGGAIFAATAASAADSPVAGTWMAEAKSDLGNFKSIWTVAQNGDAYTVDVKDAPREAGQRGPPGGGDPPKSTISDVKVDGNKLMFKRELVMGDLTIDLSYEVTVDGNLMTGTSHGSFGDIPTTGAKQ